ncbi:ABC1 kinase family protein [Nocardia carnea]|uniref:ABC1 kinase family protein n=1 Tax=Nocardia carnea TaxID=37328 RepID=A0ABW7TS99_9NOCA|nr:AarF/ABC1/UbiB kinase family protein [Nocardia carnea]
MSSRRDSGAPPVRPALRSAKLMALPVAYAGRQAAGAGRRALGRPAPEVNRDIQSRTAEHMFAVLGELKGCAAKLGQLLAIYQLALPRDIAAPYQAALARLQDSAPVMLPATVHGVMADTFGPRWRDLFREFDDRRAAAASIGQVHRGVWHDGREVAVKVMYPGARIAVESDLVQLRRVSILASVLLPGADVKSMTEALCESVRAELDYAAEAENQRTFAAYYRDSAEFYVPEVLEQRGDVLISEWVRGTPATRIIGSGTRDQRDRVGELMMRFVLTGWEQHGLLYCDPHPGNLWLLPGGRLGVADFGACAPWPHPGFIDLAVQICDAIFNGGPAALESAVRRHGFALPGRKFDAVALESALSACGEPVRHERFRLTTSWLRKQVLRTTSLRLTNVMRELTLPPDCTPFARASLTMVGTLSQLETECDYGAELVRSVPELGDVFAPVRRGFLSGAPAS